MSTSSKRHCQQAARDIVNKQQKTLSISRKRHCQQATKDIVNKQ